MIVARSRLVSLIIILGEPVLPTLFLSGRAALSRNCNIVAIAKILTGLGTL